MSEQFEKWWNLVGNDIKPEAYGNTIHYGYEIARAAYESLEGQHREGRGKVKELETQLASVREECDQLRQQLEAVRGEVQKYRHALYGNFPECREIWGISYLPMMIRILRDDKEVDRILTREDPESHYEALQILEHMASQLLEILPKPPVHDQEVERG